MRLSSLALPLVFVVFTSLLSAQALGDNAELPFTLEVEEATQDEVPGLHSFAFAHWNEWWVVVGGRVGGLHGFFPVTGFPEDEANVQIRLINPENGAQHSFPVANLSVSFPDALRATNPQYTQDGSTLYVAGGYGKDQQQGQFVTFPVLTAIDLPLLVQKMTAGDNPSAAIRQISSGNLQECGGEMEKMGDWFYLVGGHNFSGLYSENGAPTFTQTYANEIKRFKITNTPNTLAVTNLSVHQDNDELHRRDFSLAPLIRPDGSQALALYGGVFRPDVDLPFYHPVYIAEDDLFTLDAGFEQHFSQYTCPVVPIFDNQDSAMYSLFFAGLSTHFRDGNTVTYDSRVPFIRDVSALRRQADGSTTEFLLPFQFDALLGTNMIFVPADDAPQYPNEVLKLREMSGRTFVGWLFGGIRAEIPNITPSSASQRLFKVFLTPQNSSASAETSPARPTIRVLPNPSTDAVQLEIGALPDARTLRLSDSQGRSLAVLEQPSSADLAILGQKMSALPAGTYYLSVVYPQQVLTRLVVRL